MHRHPPMIASLVLLSLAVPAWPAAAQGPAVPAGPRADTPRAADWQRNCGAYMRALAGDKSGDLDVAYCLGMTLGLVDGLRLGSQIGALNFGSQLTVAYGLDSAQVFKRFEAQQPGQLLAVCAPTGTGLRAYVTAVYGWLGRNPDAATRPVTEVFFDALQSAFPCDPASAPASPEAK